MAYLGNPALVLAAQDNLPVANYQYPQDPTVDVNPRKLPCSWLNTATGEIFVCTDNTVGDNKWYPTSWHKSEIVSTSTNDDITVQVPSYVKCFEFMLVAKGTSTTPTNTYIAFNGDYSATYDREYYDNASSSYGLQPNNVPACGKVNSYGLCHVQGIITVTDLGTYFAGKYSRRTDATNITGETINLYIGSVTSLTSLSVHLADTNNNYLAGTSLYCRAI